MASVPRFVAGSAREAASLVVGGLGAGASMAMPHLTALEEPPAGWLLDLPGRGETYVIDVPGPYDGAPTVLLLHGLACTAALNWAAAFSALSEHARVVAFDLRWHGQGIDSPSFALEDCADDAAAVLSELGISSAVVVGYSLGGAVAQLVAQRHPSAVAGLVLCSTARNYRGNLGERIFFPAFDRLMAATRERAHAQVQRVRADRVARAGVDAAWASAEMSGTAPWAVTNGMNAIGRFNSAPWVGRLDVPTAVVVTAKDSAIPTRRQRALAASIPGAVAYEAPGGHASVVLEARTWMPVFLEAVTDVLGRQRIAAAV